MALLSRWDVRIEPLVTRMCEEDPVSRTGVLPNIAVCQKRAKR